MRRLANTDRAVARAIAAEETRQRDGMELIPSENYVSGPVLEALGTVFTNKYSEGYPGRRYYGGQANVDIVESLAIDRAKALFRAQHVNVQPLSGAPANLAVYAALLKPGDTVLGMDLSHGGHLTHGHPMTLPAKIYNFERYTTEPNGTLDYEKLRKIAKKTKPKLLLAGFSSYTRRLNYRAFKEIAEEVGALSMMDMAHIAGLVAGKALPNPVPYFDVVTTTTHKTLRGPRGGMILSKKEFATAIDKAVFPGLQGGPHENVIAAKAVAFKEASSVAFHKYAIQTIKNAKELEKWLKHYGFKIVFGRTDNHMLLVDVVTSKGLTGKEAEVVLDHVGITLNKNVIPDDARSPLDPSGIRLGTPAITTRGMKEKDMRLVAGWMNDALEKHDDPKALRRIGREVTALCRSYPLPHTL